MARTIFAGRSSCARPVSLTYVPMVSTDIVIGSSTVAGVCWVACVVWTTTGVPERSSADSTPAATGSSWRM